MVVVSNLRSSYQKRLDQTSQWQCGTLRIPLELCAKSLQDPQVMKDFVLFSPEEIHWLWIMWYNEITSAVWFYEAFNKSTATESGMLRPGCLFVGIGHFDDSSNTDCLMKNSEHPLLQTMLNLTLVRCQSSDSWMLVYLQPDLEVSDLEKSQSNQKSNRDILSLCCLKLYHKWSEFFYSAFKDPNQYYDLWVHCMVLAGCKSTSKWVWA